jgi:hypothetical protein
MATYRLWPATDGPDDPISDLTAYTLGVEFYVTEECDLNAFYFWLPTGGSTTSRTFRLYEITGLNTGDEVADTEVVTGSGGVWTADAWNRFALDAPVALTPDQRYRAGLWMPGAVDLRYSATSNYWSSGAGAAGITNGPLEAPQASEATDEDQGQFIDADDYPSLSFNSANYWIDVEVEDAAAGPLAPADALHAHTADAVTLTQTTTVHAASHGHAADQVTLTQKHALVPASTLHAHTADQAAFVDDAASRRTDLWDWLWHMEREGAL